MRISQAFASDEPEAFAIAQDLDVDYVFVSECPSKALIAKPIDKQSYECRMLGGA